MGELSARSRAIADEQDFVETAYAALDRQREAYSERLREVRAQQGHESAGALSERDSFATHYEDNLIRLRNVENRLVMGRLDFTDGETEHIGRIGLKDEDQEIILLDWRTPQAEPFYRATAAEPGEVVRRRHIQTRMRDVVGVEDELLDAEASEGLTDLVGIGRPLALIPDLPQRILDGAGRRRIELPRISTRVKALDEALGGVLVIGWYEMQMHRLAQGGYASAQGSGLAALAFTVRRHRLGALMPRRVARRG